MVLSFDGVNDFARSPAPTLNVPTDDTTISVWMNFGNVIAATPFKRALDLFYTSTNWFQIYLDNTGNGGLTGVTSDAGVVRGRKVTSGISANTWYHIVFTWDAGGNTGDLYLNGVIQSAAIVGTPGAGNTPGLTIGGRSDLAVNTFPEVMVDDLRVYDRVLNAAEVLTIFSARGHDGIVN